MEPEKLNDYLAQEYLAIQRFTEDFDGRALTIKAWSVTFSAAGLGLAYVQHSPLILLTAGGSAIVFWLVEALWKVNQQAYYDRIFTIEDHFAKGETTIPFQIAKSWSAAFDRHNKYWFALRVMRWPHVALPHVLIVLASIALFFTVPPV